MESIIQRHTISVAIVTRNRPESLDRCLRSLRKQQIQPFEVIVSDDSDQKEAEQTKAIVEKWGGVYIKGPQNGLYANRNYVAQACKGTHIRTMDDDHEFPEGHFQKCIEAVYKNPDIIWVIGEVYPEKKSYTKSVTLPGQLHPRGFSYLPDPTQSCWAISCGASIYPSKIIKQNILNVDYFKFGSSYLEYGSRLYWLGFKIKYLDGSYIIHHYNVNNRSFSDKKTELASIFFASFCHSFIYQKKFRNKFLTLAEVLKQVLIKRTLAIHSLIIAYQFFRIHKQNLWQESSHRKKPSSSKPINNKSSTIK